MTPSRDISRLIEIMAALRTPVTGCPWDLEQNFATIAPYTIEEAYEVADAITRGDFDDLRDELGDLLLQVVYHARMAEEENAFAFGDVVEAITRKMIRRHPHVFADKDGNIQPAGVKSAWERIKAEEKAERAARRPPEETSHKSLLSSVKASLPALTRAMELQRKAATVGFDWNDNPGETAGAWWGATAAAEAREQAAARRGYATEFDVGTYFLHDVPQEVLRAGPQQPREEAEVVFSEPCRFERWPDLPIHVLAGKDDRFFPIEFQRRVARERLGKEVEEIPGGHLVALSNPEGLTERLLAYDRALTR